MKVYRATEQDFEREQQQGGRGGFGGSSGGPRRDAYDEDDGVVKLRGLPYGATKSDIYDFFEGLEIEDNGVMMVSDNTGRFKGEAFVQFRTVEGAKTAVEKKHKANMGHRYIEVFPSSMSDANMTMAKLSAPSRDFRGGGGGPMRGGGSRPGPYDRNGGGGRGGYGGGGYGGGGYGGGYGGGGGGYGGRGGGGGYGGGRGGGGW